MLKSVAGDNFYGSGLNCIPCMTGGVCPGGYRVWALPGYWVRKYVTALCTHHNTGELHVVAVSRYQNTSVMRNTNFFSPLLSFERAVSELQYDQRAFSRDIGTLCSSFIPMCRRYVMTRFANDSRNCTYLLRTSSTLCVQ